jgi:lipopolysaccharide/colanic/teichoic acid biosynthesis glycosyltransferase
MGLIWGAALFVFGVAGAIIIPVTARVVGDDVREWLPWITKRLVERAVSRLPEQERDRFEEEWWGHINELPGNLAKVHAAWGCLSASKAINHIALSGDTTGLDSIAKVIQRVEDVTISLFVLSLTLPLILTISIWIKLDSRGPVLLKQKRRGANNMPFDLLKFRSMHVEYSDGVNHQLTRVGDRRITRVGKFLRMTGLDGLPQLMNVLRGELSLVGPQPLPLDAGAASVSYARAISEFRPLRSWARTSVKPGITGWARVNGWRGEATTIEEIKRRVEHDLYYLKYWSLTFNLLILVRTVFYVISRANDGPPTSASKNHKGSKTSLTSFLYNSIVCLINLVLSIACMYGLFAVLILAIAFLLRIFCSLLYL